MSLPPRRLLIADDETIICSIIARVSTPLGLIPTLAHTGKQAIATAQLYAAELCAVFLDVQMPDTNGVDAAIAIHRVCPNVPIVVMSGLVTADLVNRLAQLSIAGFLDKPFAVSEVRQLLFQLGLGSPTAT